MTGRKLLPNPFHIDVVTSAEAAVPADVPEIHREPFELCRSAYESVAREPFSMSVLLHGQAGCGKTHLLYRFRRWLRAEMEEKPTRPAALLVAIRMDTAPNQIWRHVRRRFATELTRRGTDGACPLDGILLRWTERHHGKLNDALDSFEDGDLGSALSLDLSKVLEHFVDGNHLRLCRAWLAGDGLSDDDLQRLNLSSLRFDEVDESIAETNARETVLSIVRLCAPLPVVFCFDQLEALEIAQQGSRGFAPFSQMGAALIDGTRNVLMISTILVTFLKALEDGSHKTDYQRISKRQIDLQPLDFQLGRKLIASRLALVPELREETPIEDEKLRAFFQAERGYATPRKLIHEARRLFEEWQRCTRRDPMPLPQFLQTEFERSWAEAAVRGGTETTDMVLAHGLPVALELLGREAAGTTGGLKVRSGERQVEVVFVNQPSMQGLAASLRHLLRRRAPDASLCLVRDQRLPISRTATATQERIQQITQSGGRLVRVDVEALAVLDAMRQLLTAATSGDLSADGEAVEPTTVREWLRENLPHAVESLAAALLGEETPAAGLDALLELLGQRKVMAVGEAAGTFEWPPEKVEEYARAHPLHLRWFGGVCPVVCLAVDAAAATETDDGR